jgi:hypothetical protein
VAARDAVLGAAGAFNLPIVHVAVNAQRAVDPILGSVFEEETEITENAGDVAVNGIPVPL